MSDLELTRRAIDKVFYDRSATASLTLDRMEELRDYIQSNIDALREEVQG